MKSYEICESSSSYIWDFFVYTKKNTEYISAYEDQSSVGAKSILTLANNLLDKGYCTSMDNFFSPTHLFNFLCNRSTDAVGTVRSNSKDVPKDLIKKTHAERGSSCKVQREIDSFAVERQEICAYVEHYAQCISDYNHFKR